MPRGGRLLELAPQLLVATSNLASALPPADLAADRPALDRFELSVETVRQSARALAAGTDVDESVQRLTTRDSTSAKSFAGCGARTRRLAWRHCAAKPAQANLESATRLFEEARVAIGTVGCGRRPARCGRDRGGYPSTKKRAAYWPSTGASASAARGPPRISARRR